MSVLWPCYKRTPGGHKDADLKVHCLLSEVTGAGNFERALRIHEAREHHAEHFQLQLGKERREFEARKTARQSVLQSARFSRRNERGDPESRETKHGGRL